jgi:hypothetical protein
MDDLVQGAHRKCHTYSETEHTENCSYRAHNFMPRPVAGSTESKYRSHERDLRCSGRALKLDPAFLLNAGLLDRVHLAFELGEFC